MKYLKNLLLMAGLFMSGFCFSQATQPYFSARAQINSSVPSGAHYRVNMGITDETGVYDGTDVSDVNQDFYLLVSIVGSELKLYRVDTVVNQFASQVTVSVFDVNSVGAPPSSGIYGLSQRNEAGMFTIPSGVSDALVQAVRSYNSGVLSVVSSSLLEWKVDGVYEVNEMVSHNGFLYKNVTGDNTGSPPVTPIDWDIYPEAVADNNGIYDGGGTLSNSGNTAVELSAGNDFSFTWTGGIPAVSIDQGSGQVAMVSPSALGTVGLSDDSFAASVAGVGGLSFSLGNLVLTDNRATPRGLALSADYSSNFTDLHLINKKYFLDNDRDGIYGRNDTIPLGRYALSKSFSLRDLAYAVDNGMAIEFITDYDGVEEIIGIKFTNSQEWGASAFKIGSGSTASAEIISDDELWIQSKDMFILRNDSLMLSFGDAGPIGEEMPSLVVQKNGLNQIDGFRGITYLNDFSDAFIDRSLPDIMWVKNYADTLSVGSRTWYVNKNNANCSADSGPGQLFKPFCDPWQAVDSAKVGDVVHVLEGMWTVGDNGSGAYHEMPSNNYNLWFEDGTIYWGYGTGVIDVRTDVSSGLMGSEPYLFESKLGGSWFRSLGGMNYIGDGVVNWGGMGSHGSQIYRDDFGSKVVFEFDTLKTSLQATLVISDDVEFRANYIEKVSDGDEIHYVLRHIADVNGIYDIGMVKCDTSLIGFMYLGTDGNCQIEIGSMEADLIRRGMLITETPSNNSINNVSIGSIVETDSTLFDDLRIESGDWVGDMGAIVYDGGSFNEDSLSLLNVDVGGYSGYGVLFEVKVDNTLGDHHVNMNCVNAVSKDTVPPLYIHRGFGVTDTLEIAGDGRINLSGNYQGKGSVIGVNKSINQNDYLQYLFEGNFSTVTDRPVIKSYNGGTLRMKNSTLVTPHTELVNNISGVVTLKAMGVYTNVLGTEADLTTDIDFVRDAGVD